LPTIDFVGVGGVLSALRKAPFIRRSTSSLGNSSTTCDPLNGSVAMPMPADLAARKREETLEAAAAFLEDMQHIREILARPNPIRGELRRLSNILRRLLPDRDLQNIAPCRNLDPLQIDAPDNTKIEPLIKSEKGIFVDFRGELTRDFH
jgi:hypothetical protein